MNANLEEIGDKLSKPRSIFDKNLHDKMEAAQILKEEVNENFSNEILLHDSTQQAGYASVVGSLSSAMPHLRNMTDSKSVEEWINTEFGGVETVSLLQDEGSLYFTLQKQVDEYIEMVEFMSNPFINDGQTMVSFPSDDSVVFYEPELWCFT